MNEDELEAWINKLIESNELWKFYKSKQFRRLRKEVLNDDHHECQICRCANATIAHHVQHVRKYPRLALSKYYCYKGKKHRNLISVCKTCHNILHPEKHKGYKKPITEERC